MRLASILILLYFFIPPAVFSNRLKNFPKFQELGLRDGLTNLNVSSITQDNLGYIWIGTARGVFRYNGTYFKHYLHSNEENSLYRDMVSKLFLNQDGIIFISSNGVNSFDTNKDKMYRIGTENGTFFDFFDFNNKTYGLSITGGICVYNKVKNSFERLPHIANNRLINFAITDEKTGIWARSIDSNFNHSQFSNNLNQKSQNQVLVNYNPFTNTFNKYEIPNSDYAFSNNRILKIDSTIILFEKEIVAFNLNTRQFIPLPNKWNNLYKLKNLELWAIEQFNKKTIWFGTRTKGLYIFDLNTNTLVNLNNTNSNINSNFIRCIFKDRDDNIWVGTFDHGVNVAFKGRGNVNPDNYLNTLTKDKFINCITSDVQDNYYIGTRNFGFYVYNSTSKTSKKFNTKNSFLTSDHIRTIYVDSEQKLWIADQKALHITNLSSNRSKSFFINGQNEGMISLCERSGMVFAASDAQGFFIFEKDGTLIRHELKLGSNISQIIPISDDELLVATWANGIYYYKISTSESHNIYNPDNSENYSSTNIITMHIDADSILWMGSYMNGLHKLNLKNNDISVYTMLDGLPNNDVVGIVEDSLGTLWLSTSYGICHFDKKQEFVNYFYNEGFENLQFHAQASHIDKNGMVYFSGNNGLSYFNPNILAQSVIKQAPSTILESITIQNKKIYPEDETGILSEILNKTSKIKLKHNLNNISIEYQAFDFVAANEIRYSYILEGLDKEWNMVGKRTYANFSNLKPGNYTFRVKAQNNQSLWSKEASLHISIKPSPFLTVWAMAIYFIFISAIIFLSFYLIVRAKLFKTQLDFEHNERVRENEVAQMKLRFFTNISHEIRTPLTIIKGNIDLLSRNLKIAKEEHSAVNGIKYATNRLLDLVNQLLLLRKLENDALDLKLRTEDIIHITNQLIQPHSYIASNRNIAITVESRFDSLQMPLDADKYDKIISNLLSNSLKHAKVNGQIKIVIEELIQDDFPKYFPDIKTIETNYFVKISVIDNGSGIANEDLPTIFDRYKQSESVRYNPDYSGTGIGLNFAKRLVELHKGSIIVNSIENLETCFSFVLPLMETAYEVKDWIDKKSLLATEITNFPDSYMPTNSEYKGDLILVVEDDLELNRFITTSLEKQYKVISSYNGKEGFHLAKNQLPALILSDIMMPEMDGYELCRSIREDDMISHIPIILLTAKSDDESKVEGFGYGADDYISKPFNFDILIARINNLILQRKKLQQFFKIGIIGDQATEIKNPYELNFIKKIESIVANNYHNPDFNVNELADKMNMSRANFYRKFMNIMDISPKDFITKYRIIKAVEMIKNGNDNFAEISQSCGFKNQSIFSTVFKKVKGITPMQFKQAM